LKKGIAPRAEIGRPEDARKYLDRGVKHFCIGWDVGILANWFKENGKAMRQVLGREAVAEQTARTYPR
jgi:4-hydroxy-2-oxoheptanedioate aldolase